MKSQWSGTSRYFLGLRAFRTKKNSCLDADEKRPFIEFLRIEKILSLIFPLPPNFNAGINNNRIQLTAESQRLISLTCRLILNKSNNKVDHGIVSIFEFIKVHYRIIFSLPIFRQRILLWRGFVRFEKSRG